MKRMTPSLLLSILFAVTALTGCADSAATDTGSICPPPTEACMNDDNYQECLDAEATCDGPIAIMESCPLQFGCMN